MKQRSDGRWEKVITIEGKRVHFYSTEQTEKKATSDINRQLLQYHDELHRVKHNFGAIVQCVLERKYDEVEEATYKSYLYASLKLESLFKDDIEDITPVRFNAVLDDLASKKYSRSGISKVKILASLACEEAILNGINIQNFAKSSKIPKKAKKAEQKSPISDNDIRIIYENADRPFGMFAFLLLFSGMRRGEALALQKKDIDLKTGLIHVTKSVGFSVNTPVIKTPKTKNSIRTIPIMPIMSDKLKAFLKEKKADDYLFGGDKPISKTAVTKRWMKYAKETNLTATPHQLRHTFSYLQYRSGTDAKTLQGLLGHANVQTSLNIYTAFDKEVSKASMNKANELASSIVDSQVVRQKPEK